MADFHTLNHNRRETLEAMKAILDQENALWELWLGGNTSGDMLEKIRDCDVRFHDAFQAHHAAREAMYNAGLIPR